MGYKGEKYDIESIIGYLRRSRQDLERERRTGEDTLATQRKIINKVLDDFGIPYDIVEEIGSGDKIDTRPVFQQVLRYLEEGKYNSVAVKEVARLGRGNYGDMGRVYDIIINKKVYVVTPYKIYDPQNPADLQQIRFQLFFAREEYESIRERMLSSKLSLASEGRWVVGATPYGYMLDRRTTRLVIVPEEAEVVKLIFDLYVDGLGQPDGSFKDVAFKAIATYLNTLNIPTPRKAPNGWTYLSVQRIIDNVAYIGTFQYRTRKRVGNKYYDRPESEWIVVEEAHDPIIGKELFDAAQERRKSRHIPRTKLDFSPCELAGQVVCGRCGKRMVRQYSIQHYQKKDGGESIYHKEFLWCTNNGCTFVKYRDVEEDILETLVNLGKADVNQLRKLYKQSILSGLKANGNDKNNLQETADKKRREIKRKMEFLLEKYMDGIVDDDQYKSKNSQLKKELDEINSLVPDQDNLEVVDTPKINKAILEFINKVNEVLTVYKASKNKTVKNELLSSVIDHVILTKTGKGTYELDAKTKIGLR
jgi:DNA invertase Pin-like site-specific DNA recombinase/Zn-finger protein